MDGHVLGSSLDVGKAARVAKREEKEGNDGDPESVAKPDAFLTLGSNLA